MDLVTIFLGLLIYLSALGQLNANNGNDKKIAKSDYHESLLVLWPNSSQISTFVNEKLMISCKAVQKDINATWKEPTGAVLENKKGRVHVEKNAQGILSLVFEHILPADKGNWTCEATVDRPNLYFQPGIDPVTTIAMAVQRTRKSFELLVYQKISFEGTEAVQSAPEGRDARVICLVQGDPAPQVSWEFNGESLNTRNSTKHKRLSDGLYIKNLNKADAGEYTCSAKQVTPTFAEFNTVTILLRIQHKPYWLHNETSLSEYAYIGGFVNISCVAMGEPPPSFMWMWIHGDRALVGPNYKVFYADYGSTLQIHMHNETQFGDYKCKVANPLGTLERVFKIKQGQKPPSPTRFQLMRMFSDGFEFDIRSKIVDDAMRIFGYRVDYMTENDFKYCAGNWSYAKKREFSFHSRHRFRLEGLKPNTTYLMRVASRNLAGLSDWSSVQTFATLTNLACHTFAVLTWKTTTLIILLGFIVRKF